MKKNFWTWPRVAAFSIAHTAGTLALIFLLALLVGCIKKPDTENIDFGPETTRDAVHTHLIEGLGNRSWLDAQKGDFAVYQVTVQPFTEGIINGGINSYEILDRKDLGNEVELQVLHRIYKPDGTLDQEQGQTCLVHKGTLNSQCLYAEFNYLIPGTGSSSFHNLSTSYRTEEPDAELKDAPNCSGIPNCRFTVKHLEFDRVFDRTNPEGRVNFTIDIGYESVFFALPIRWCIRQHQTYNGRYIPVTQCRNLKKLKFGNVQANSANEIQTAIQNALTSRPPTQSQIGDTGIHYLLSKEPGTNEFASHFEARSVQSKTDQGTHFDLGIQVQLYDREGHPTSSKQEVCQIPKDGSEHTCSHFANPYSHLHEEPGSTVQYLNLTVGQYQDPPPKSVQDKPNCGGVPNCQVNYKVIRFQKKVTKSGVSTSSYHFVEVSPDLPPLSSVSYQCEGGLRGATGSPTPYLRCDYLTDFEHGN